MSVREKMAKDVNKYTRAQTQGSSTPEKWNKAPADFFKFLDSGGNHRGGLVHHNYWITRHIINEWQTVEQRRVTQQIISACQQSCRKVKFSLMSVCSQGSPYDHYLWCNGPHCTGPNDPNPSPPLTVTSGCHHWRPVQTCLLEDPNPTGTDIWWLKRAARILLENFNHHFLKYWFGIL